jgi:hypothetical protein
MSVDISETVSFYDYRPDRYADPLGAREILIDIPEMMEDRDPRPLINAVQSLTPAVPIHELPRIWEPGVALGALNVVDTAVSALRRRLTFPFEFAPELMPAAEGLATIAGRVDGAPLVPRATGDIYPYPMFLNDMGRVATFSNLEAEITFLDDIGASFEAARRGAAAMSDMDLLHHTNEHVAARLDYVTEQIKEVHRRTMHTMRTYGKQAEAGLGTFAETHQLNFKGWQWPGSSERIDASSAAQLPSKEVEWMLRGFGASTDMNGSAYALSRFYIPNIAYTPRGRLAEVDKFKQANDGMSVFEYLIKLPEDSPRRAAIGAAYVRLAKAFSSFSIAHNKGLQRDAEYRVKKWKGGGGFDFEDLQMLQDERDDHLAIAERLFLAA